MKAEAFGSKKMRACRVETRSFLTRTLFSDPRPSVTSSWMIQVFPGSGPPRAMSLALMSVIPHVEDVDRHQDQESDRRRDMRVEPDPQTTLQRVMDVHLQLGPVQTLELAQPGPI